MCTLLLLLSALKCSSQVEFYSFSIGSIGNYYFIVSPAENGSSESVYFLFCRVQMVATQTCLLPASSSRPIPFVQWMETVGSTIPGYKPSSNSDTVPGWGNRAEEQADSLRTLDNHFI